jgi:ferredoxin-type protein NapH
MKTRQKIRKGILLFSFLLFPLIWPYGSPVLIIRATLKGIVNGTFIIFLLMFVLSFFLGRAFCGWACPTAACLEGFFIPNHKKVTKGNYIKWIIWIPWVSAIAILAVIGGGYQKIDFLYDRNIGLSIGDVNSLIIYIIIHILVLFLLIFITPAVGTYSGKRAACHHLCWIAPFMVIGRKIRNGFKWPSLQLQADPEKCKHCQKCSDNCPMSLPVEDMVEQNKMENAECILCGTCTDVCKLSVIKYSFRNKA